MQKRILTILTGILLSVSLQLKAQNTPQDTVDKKFFVGSTLFMLANLAPEDGPGLIQLNLGYRVNAKNLVSFEMMTWKYAFPLGIPFGDSFDAPEEEFPGYIREYGFDIAYQHYWWKGLYSSIHVMSAWQSFVDTDGAKIGKGFQIFNTYRILGYHFKLFNNQFFIEPSIAVTHRPYHTEMPESFKQKDDRWSKFFVGEPGLHFGYNF